MCFDLVFHAIALGIYYRFSINYYLAWKTYVSNNISYTKAMHFPKKTLIFLIINQRQAPLSQ